MDKELIAPCGANCAVCSGYLALKYKIKEKGIRMAYCAGCRPRGKQCAFLKKKCMPLLNNKIEFCYECKDFPCSRLKHISDRYQKLFRTSFIGNLEFIEKSGVEKFLKSQEEKWRCKRCGGTICCHNDLCFVCDFKKLKDKNIYGKNKTKS